MKEELIKEIKSHENDLLRWIEKRDNLRNKIRFCNQHKFDEEVRISLSELKHFEALIYDCECFIKNLKEIVNGK
jgi:hypothetical protein